MDDNDNGNMKAFYPTSGYPKWPHCRSGDCYNFSYAFCFCLLCHRVLNNRYDLNTCELLKCCMFNFVFGLSTQTKEEITPTATTFQNAPNEMITLPAFIT